MQKLVQTFPFQTYDKPKIIANLQHLRRKNASFREIKSSSGERLLEVTLPMIITANSATQTINCKILLDKDFPSKQPSFYLEKQSQPFTKSQYLASDGRILIEEITSWQQDCDLNQLCEIINDCFNNSPPFAIESNAKPKATFANDVLNDLLVEAESLITRRNEVVHQMDDSNLQLKLLRHLDLILDKSSPSRSSSTESLPTSTSNDESLRNYISPDLSKFQPKVQQQILMKANEDGSQETIRTFFDIYTRNNSAQIDGFLREYQKMCDHHFTKYIWPQLS